MSILKINNNNYQEEVLNSDETVLIDFYADWCGPCKMLAPIIEEISNELSNIKFGKVNIDESPKIAEKYGIMSIPTLVLVKEGKAEKTLVGLHNKQDILDILK